MKLLTKTSLNYLSVTLFVFMFGTIAFYYLLRNQVNQNINIELEKRKSSIINQLLSAHSSVVTPPNQNEKVVISLLNEMNAPKLNFYDTVFYEPSQRKYVPFRQLGFVADFNHTQYYIQIYKSLEETDNLIVRIFLIMTILVFLIIIALLITVRHTSLKAWNVFYDTIDKINKYDINSHDAFALKQSEVKEFEELNTVLSAMTDRIKHDYSNMKEYTENASHELQTPLAIINMKLELLLQSRNLDDKQLKALVEAYEATNRLSKLNKTLLLLAKIENRQFPESGIINPVSIIQSQLDSFEDMIDAKHIKASVVFEEEISLNMNPYLAEILFANLIKNGIRHNIQGGELVIKTGNKTITVSNSGNELKADTVSIFERFHKNSASPESLGLGLAIVKKICDIYKFNVNYFYENNLHHFSIDFGKGI
ncbi:MAG: HAMP domain-containing sensor histidine kinase [Bacteroidetes bacterium]|nr:HAMP domain-containing sensor histidine kinase [Bacteroidota bacterium]